jgi:hypothetical protein
MSFGVERFLEEFNYSAFKFLSWLKKTIGAEFFYLI